MLATLCDIDRDNRGDSKAQCSRTRAEQSMSRQFAVCSCALLNNTDELLLRSLLQSFFFSFFFYFCFVVPVYYYYYYFIDTPLHFSLSSLQLSQTWFSCQLCVCECLQCLQRARPLHRFVHWPPPPSPAAAAEAPALGHHHCHGRRTT